MRLSRTRAVISLLLSGTLLSGCSSIWTGPSENIPHAPSPTGTSASASTGTFAQSSDAAPSTPAVEDAMALLEDRDRPWVITVIGDSTGNEPDEWALLVVNEIAKRYDRPVTVHRWDIETNIYADDLTVGSGANAPIILWNGSASGKDGLYSASYFRTLAPEKPDLAIINHGHNMRTAAAAIQQVKSLEQMLGETWDEAPAVAVTVQNPRTDAGKTKMKDLSAGIKDEWKGSTVKILDVQSAFEASGNVPELLTEDGYHPNDAGHLLWAESVLTSITPPAG